MPLIPGVNQRSVTPDAANTPYFKIDTTADEFGAGIGKSMLGLENGVIDAANTAVDVKQKLAAKAKPKPPQGDDGYHIVLPMPQFSPDLSKAIDATNTFNAGAQDLTSNFLQLSGKDAVDGQAEAQRGIDQLKDQVLANASTPAAGDRAQQAVNHWADGAKSIIDRHATAQQRVYDDDLDNTQVALGGNSVGLLYNDDQHYLTQLHVASQARADQVLRAGANDNPAADPDTLAATIASAQQATASDFTRTRIESALGQGDLATATALHQRWGGDLLPADQDAVSQHLTYASFNQDSRQAADQAMSITQPVSLGRQRNADMVLHRSGGGENMQLADTGSENGAQIPLSHDSSASQRSGNSPQHHTSGHAHETPRVVDDSNDARKADILSNGGGSFFVGDNPKAKDEAPAIESPLDSQVYRFSAQIDKAAKQTGIDPNLIRAVMFMETTHGGYDKILDQLGINKSILPMNINVDYWGNHFGTRDDLHDPYLNILAGARMLRAIENNLPPGSSIEKVATLYQNHKARIVSDYGARVARIYKERLWDQMPSPPVMPAL